MGATYAIPRPIRGGRPDACLLMAVAVIGASTLGAATSTDASSSQRGADKDVPASLAAIRLEHADALHYDSASGWLTARGRVRIRQGDQVLSADEVRVHLTTRKARAVGHVTLMTPRGVLSGSVLEGNLGTGHWKGTDVSADARPFRLLDSACVSRDPRNVFRIQQGVVTTCTNASDSVHFHVSVGQTELFPGRYLKAHHAVWYFGSVPVFYLPYWYRNLEENLGLDLQPGHSRRMGTFLLGSYSYRLNPWLTGKTQLDYRTRRGLAGGQEWCARNRRSDRWRADLEAYYANDLHPVDEDDDPARDHLDTDRARVFAAYRHAFSDQNELRFQCQYVSDADVLEDFFEREYRRQPQPENYLVYTHRGRGYLASVWVRRRVNPFYTEVNRMPEVTWDRTCAELGTSGIYYESHTAAGYLEKVWADAVTNQADYALGRADTLHRFYYPSRLAGFLTVTPRAGVRLTYYSKTRDPGPEPNESGVGAEYRAGGSPGIRVCPEIGCEASYRAFKTWRGGLISPLRHIVEPYADYTLFPEPNLLPEELYAFDSVDTLRRNHAVRFGFRNRWQTKRENRILSFALLDVSTRVRMERNAEESVFDHLGVQAEWTPADWLSVDLKGAYDWYEGVWATLDARATVLPRHGWRGSLEFTHRQDEASVLRTDAGLRLHADWECNGFGRYAFQDSRLEEIGGYVQKNLDCLSLRAGLSYLPGFVREDGTRRDEDWRFIVEMWLTAFPKVRIGTW